VKALVPHGSHTATQTCGTRERRDRRSWGGDIDVTDERDRSSFIEQHWRLVDPQAVAGCLTDYLNRYRVVAYGETSGMVYCLDDGKQAEPAQSPIDLTVGQGSGSW
jgi:hypothetical protein